MKLNKWLYGIAAMAMLAACSDRDVAPGGENGDDGTIPATSGYVAVEIKLPQEVGTRADGDGNATYDDGDPNEYDVDNAMIIIFKGKDEMSAKFHRAQDLKKPFFTNMPANDNITSSYLAAVQVSKTVGDTSPFWGLVILNRNETSTAVTGLDDQGKETVMIGGVTFTTESTFAEVLNAITENSFLLTEGTTPDTKTYSRFFMTNAPMSKARGGISDGTGIGKDNIQYLANLGSETYATIDEAKANMKSCIYVERAVAKVTCSAANDAFQLNLIDGEGNPIPDLKVSAKVRYALTNTNKKSYVVRNVEFSDKHFSWDLKNINGYRMIGETAMPALKNPYHEEPDLLFRTYWCMDPNYDQVMKPSEKNLVEKAEEFTSISKPLYCKENTFTVANQNHGNTTLAIFQVDYTITDKDGKAYGDGSLYTKGGDNSKIYVSAKAAASAEITRILNDADIVEALKEAAIASGIQSGKVENVGNHLIVNFEVKDNTLYITSIGLAEKQGAFNAAGVAKFNQIIGGADTPGSIQHELLGSINAMNDIEVYAGGISYYTIPIKHFGDFYCPWTEVTGTTTAVVYNNGKAFDASNEDNEHARLYLGRYGMVRNNWYALHISSIKSLESPGIPTIDIDLSDDNKEEKRYVGVEIHILSWAKRTQSVEF